MILENEIVAIRSDGIHVHFFEGRDPWKHKKIFGASWSKNGSCLMIYKLKTMTRTQASKRFAKLLTTKMNFQ